MSSRDESQGITWLQVTSMVLLWVLRLFMYVLVCEGADATSLEIRGKICRSNMGFLEINSGPQVQQQQPLLIETTLWLSLVVLKKGYGHVFGPQNKLTHSKHKKEKQNKSKKYIIFIC